MEDTEFLLINEMVETISEELKQQLDELMRTSYSTVIRIPIGESK